MYLDAKTLKYKRIIDKLNFNSLVCLLMMMLKEKTNAEEMAQIIDEKKEEAQKLLDALTSIGLAEKSAKNGKVEYSLKKEIAENKLLRARVGSRILSSLEG